MHRPANISYVIDGNADKSKYDTEVKKILSDGQILAWILKCTVREFCDYSLGEIQKCVVGAPEVGVHSIRPGHYTEAIESMNTEDAVPGELTFTYDIRFRVRLHDRSEMGLIINVEAQKDFYPGYDLVSRGVFYCARLLSAQMGSELSAKEYDKLQKVYSIWICMEVPRKVEYTITRYRMNREDAYGHAEVETRYDLMEVVMVCLGETGRAEKGTKLHGLLNTLLSSEIKPEEKKKILSQKYEIVTSVELEGGLVRMCNLSEAIEERGIECGMEQGKIKTISVLYTKGRLTLEEAAEELEISVEEFQEQLKKEQ